MEGDYMFFLIILLVFSVLYFSAKNTHMKSNLDLLYSFLKIFNSFPSHFSCPNTEKSEKVSSEFATSRSSYLYFATWVLWVSVIFGNSDEKMSGLQTSDSIHIREVWNDNLVDEFAMIREIVDDFPFIAMDTEFPGVILRPLGTYKHPNEYNFYTLKENVDILKLIQLGLTFSDEKGNLPTCGTGKFCVWQFNFREFNINEDMYAHDSIVLLTQSGIDFNKNMEDGVDVLKFSELLMSSGIVLNDNVQWVTFHSGYDFGYLLKLLTGKKLPDTPIGFFFLMKIFFPNLYDIKHLMQFSNSLHGGLNKLAELLNVQRVGSCHQAGSDSLLTCCAFFKMKEYFFNGETEKYGGVLYGLGVENGENYS